MRIAGNYISASPRTRADYAIAAYECFISGILCSLQAGDVLQSQLAGYLQNRAVERHKPAAFEG